MKAGNPPRQIFVLLCAAISLIVLFSLSIDFNPTAINAAGPPDWELNEMAPMEDADPPPALLQLYEKDLAAEAPLRLKSGEVFLAAGLNKLLANLERQMAAEGDKNPTVYVIVQYQIQPAASEKAAMNAWGYEEVEYIPDRAYMVRLPVDRLTYLAGQSNIHAVVPLQPEWKIDPALATAVTNTLIKTHPITLIAFEPLTLPADSPLFRLDDSLNYRGQLSAGQIEEFLHDPLVKWIEPYYANQSATATSANVIGADFAWGQGLDGNGVGVGIIDSGIESTHDHFNSVTNILFEDDFVDGGTPDDCVSNGHGTHVAGTIAGSGTFNGQTFQGIAPDATLIVERVFDCSGGWHDGGHSYAYLFDQVANRGADVISNSWGHDSNETYNSAAHDVDVWALANPNVVLVFANGNGCDPYISTSCADDGHSPAIAKNVIAVGATEDGSPSTNAGRPTATSADNVDLISELNNVDGPVDGRTKPDVNAPGQWTTSSVPGNTYETWLGTSMATPHVSGLLALFLELYPNSRADVVKASLINASVPLNGKPGQTAYLPSWGRVSAPDMLYRLAGESVGGSYWGALNTTTTLQCHDFTVASGSAWLKTTLAYWDPAGSTNANPALVNNVDLFLHRPGGTWWSNTSTINNVEQIIFNNPEAGNWQVCAHLPSGLNSGTSQTYAIALSVMDDLANLNWNAPSSMTVNQGETFSVNTSVTISNWFAYGAYATVASNYASIQLQSGSQSGMVWGDLIGETQTFQPQYKATTCGSFPNAFDIAIGATNFSTVTRSVDVQVNCPGDAYEDDDTSGQASWIYSGTPQTHSIVPAGDVDWVKFYLGAESAVTLETSGASGDTELWLYNSSVSQIDYDDDGGTNAFSLINRTCATDPLPAGTYYAKVEEYYNTNQISSYTLALTATACSASCSTPGTPVLVSPSNGATINDSTPLFDWNTAVYASEYQIQVDNNSSFGSPEIEVMTANSQYTAVTPLPNDTYYWRVRGHNTSGSCNTFGSWTSLRTVTINTGSTGSDYFVYLPVVLDNYDSSIIYSDDFSNSGSGWYVGDNTGYLTAYTGGEYRVYEKDSNGWVLPAAPFQCENCRIDVDARFEGTPYHGYGVFFAGSGDNWYMFVARLDTGQCDLVKHASSGWTLLASKSCSLQTTGNHLRVEWQAPAIRAYVNNTLIHSINNSSFSGEADIGVLTYWEGDARFDDFVVRALP